MASKKYTFILGLISLFSSAIYAQQSDAGYDWRDSSKIATKNLPQNSEFLNNQYPYPAKPRDMWEFGIHGGYSIIRGDVTVRPGFGGGFSLRKSLGHVFSVRAMYTGSFNYGLNTRTKLPSEIPATSVNDPFRTYYGVGNRPYIPNYRTAIHQGSLEVVAVLNNGSHYKGNPKTNIYVFGGYSLLLADVDVDALGANGAPYNFAAFNFSRGRKDIRKDLKNLMNLDYESNGGVTYGNRGQITRVFKDNQLLRHAFHGGVGFAYKLSNKVNLAIEQRYTAAFDDNLDGSALGRSNDYVSYTSGHININLGSSAKRVQPLNWINPNNFVYNEINKPSHMLLPPPVLPDADGDGVTDQFDMEPNTPKGAPVDVRGVSKDTDGDGVPDYKDKELLTSQKCFPVDADGVGTCPEPACCTELRARLDSGNFGSNNCGIGNLPSVMFRTGSATLSKDAQAILKSAADQMKNSPTCKIRVTGHGASDKRAQQLSWDRVNAVIRNLVEKQGIAEDRFIFDYGTEGDPNTVDLMGTTEAGPNTVPAPHPNLRG